jgi:hypothetical protein
MTKEQAQELKPFDVVVSDLGYGENKDLLVKQVTDSGVFCIERIQSTAALYKFNQIKKQYEI